MKRLHKKNVAILQQATPVAKVKTFSKDDARAFLDAWVPLREELRRNGVVDYDQLTNGDRVPGTSIVIDGAGTVHPERAASFYRVKNERADPRFSVSRLGNLIPVGATVAYLVMNRSLLVVDLDAPDLDGAIQDLSNSTTSSPSWPQAIRVDVEQHGKDSSERKGTKASTTRRSEQPLVTRFKLFLLAAGHEAIRWQITTRPATPPIYCDLFDASAGVLVEGKSDSSRSSVRMAIGQLSDYGFHLRASEAKDHRRVILLPTVPAEDLVELLDSLDISIVVPADDGFVAVGSGKPWWTNE